MTNNVMHVAIMQRDTTPMIYVYPLVLLRLEACLQGLRGGGQTYDLRFDSSLYDCSSPAVLVDSFYGEERRNEYRSSLTLDDKAPGRAQQRTNVVPQAH